jgi:hypothetical protein
MRKLLAKLRTKNLLPSTTTESKTASKKGKTIVYTIDEDSCRFVYSPEAISIATRNIQENNPTIRRASHVEPDEHGEWWVDLSPVNGPILGPYPPDQRHRALQDEVSWLNQNEWKL